MTWPPASRFLRSHAARSIGVYVAVAILWEIVGRLELIGGGAFPALSDILSTLWTERSLYPAHTLATTSSAFIGYVIGNVIAIGAAVAFMVSPRLERLMRGIGIALFSVPLIAVVPILVLAFTGSTPRIILAAVAVYFTTMASTLIGLRDIDPRLEDFVMVSGGRRSDVLRRIRLRNSVPGIVAGLRVGAPAAVLGAILAEYGSGTRTGLGTFLLGSLGQGDPARLWGIGFVATAISAGAYVLLGYLERRLAGKTTSASVMTVTPATLGGTDNQSRSTRALFAVASFAATLGAWQLFVSGVGLSPIIARGPIDFVRYLVSSPQAAASRRRLLEALGETVPLTFVGLAIGLLFAFVLATFLSLRPLIAQGVMPFALISQTMPLVALTPLIVLIFGRGVTTTMVITISVTFFPAFVATAQGLSQAHSGTIDVVKTYNGSDLQVLRLVQVPTAVPYLISAARLAAPRALLGVMIAEWLATGKGLGQLLNESRGLLDYGMIWAVAAISVFIAAGFYAGIGLVERSVARRYAN